MCRQYRPGFSLISSTPKHVGMVLGLWDNHLHIHLLIPKCSRVVLLPPPPHTHTHTGILLGRVCVSNQPYPHARVSPDGDWSFLPSRVCCLLHCEFVVYIGSCGCVVSSTFGFDCCGCIEHISCQSSVPIVVLCLYDYEK